MAVTKASIINTLSSLSHKGVHVINPMKQPYGGAEKRALELCKSIARFRPVTLWSPGNPHPILAEEREIKLLRPRQFSFPINGTFIYVGTDWQSWRWLRFARPHRIVVIHNDPNTITLAKLLSELSKRGLRERVVVTYAAKWLRDTVGISGPVCASPVDIELFSPQQCDKVKKDFTIGRLSRDTLEKHDPNDVDLYRECASLGIRVRIMGGTCLSRELAGHNNIALLPCGAESPADFIRSLDVFFYRTDTARWVEPHGRVVTEALSCGVPVVCGGEGGFLEWISDGSNGFVVNNNFEAIERILPLRDDLDLLARMSHAARETALKAFSQTAIDQNLKTILGIDNA